MRDSLRRSWQRMPLGAWMQECRFSKPLNVENLKKINNKFSIMHLREGGGSGGGGNGGGGCVAPGGGPRRPQAAQHAVQDVQPRDVAAHHRVLVHLERAGRLRPTHAGESHTPSLPSTTRLYDSG